MRVTWSTTIGEPNEPPDRHNVLAIQATSVRRERTGIHARVDILLDGRPISWSTFNVERDEDRTRLSNAAARKLGPAITKLYPPLQLKHDLDKFCAGLWDRWLDQFAPRMLEGADGALHHYLDPYVIRGAGTILYGPPGAGKTYLALLWARLIEAGDTSLWPTRRARVLVVQMERSAESFARRVHAVNAALGLDPRLPLYTIVARGRTLRELRDVIGRTVERDGVDVVILDSISRAGMGSLKDDEDANQVMDALNAVAETWVAIAHTSHEGAKRPSEAHTYGSIMFQAACDLEVIAVPERQEDTLGVMLQVTKNNEGPIGHTDYIAFEFGESGLCGIRRARRDEFAEAAAYERRSAVATIYDYVLHHGPLSASDVADTLGLPRTTVTSVLTRRRDLFLRVSNPARDGGKFSQALYAVRASR